MFDKKTRPEPNFPIFSEYTYVMKAAADREKLADESRRLSMWCGKPIRGTAGLKNMEIRAANDFFRLAERFLARVETELASAETASTPRATLLDLKEKVEARVAALTLREA